MEDGYPASGEKDGIKRQCHLVNGTGRREEHKKLRHHAFAR